jgi:hypothetical protein
MSDRQLANDLGLIEHLSKAFAVALGLLYLLGFLVVALHLAKYGVSSFSVLQLQYLIAGIWLLGPLAFQGCITLISRRFEERAAPEVLGKFNWRRTLISLLFTGIPSVIFLSLMIGIPTIAHSITGGVIWQLLAFYIAMMVLAQIFWMSVRTEMKQETWLNNRSHAAPFYFVTLLIIVMWYAVWFSSRIYPLIPFSLGGGKQLTVVFIEGEKILPNEIQKPDRSAKRSIPYKLLLATDKYYVVVSPVPKEKSVEVSRDAVAGIIVLE